MDTKRLMQDTRARLIMSRPFFGFPAMNLELREEPGIETICVDGVTLAYNPQYVAALPDSERQGLIAHEAAHCMLGHVFRRKGRDMEMWNQACDYVVNEHLQANGFSLPADGLFDSAYHGMSAEQVYEALKSMPPSQRPLQKPDDVKDCPGQDAAPGQGNKPGKDNKPGQGEQESRPLAPDEVEAKWKVAVVQASHLAQAAGKSPAGMEMFVEAAKEPHVDWKSALREFVSTTVPHDYRMFPANRRHLWRGMYLPSIARRPCPKLLVVIDSSGSTRNVVGQFVCELNAIMTEMRCLIHVVTCDTQVYYVGTFEDEQIGDITISGGGGTSFEPPFQWAQVRTPEIDGVVYLTDGYGLFPASSQFNTLWVISTHIQAPWGETVRIPLVA